LLPNDACVHFLSLVAIDANVPDERRQVVEHDPEELLARLQGPLNRSRTTEKRWQTPSDPAGGERFRSRSSSVVFSEQKQVSRKTALFESDVLQAPVGRATLWGWSDAVLKPGETDMGDKGSKDKGKKEQQKKAQRTPKEKRKLNKAKKNTPK
jgi:hypothetical protein